MIQKEFQEKLNDNLDHITRDSIARALWMKEFEVEKIPEDVLKNLCDDKNSPQSFGERMRYRLQDLLDHPDSFTPNYRKRYETFLKHSQKLTPMQAYVMTHLLGLDSSRGYQKIPDESNLEFPRDHSPQLGYQVGWHFLVGNCTDDRGKEYGILVSFYRYTLLPPGVAHHFGLKEWENQIFEMQLAVAEAGGQHLQAKPFAIAGTTGILKFTNQPFSYRAGKNSIKSLKEDELFPLQVRAWGINLGREIPVEMEVQLRLSSNKEFLLQGNKGCLPCCCGIGTLYFSATNLTLEPGSILKQNGEEIHLQDGKFWFDHQWGNSLEPLGNSRCEVIRAANNLSKPSSSRGWDWFMAQFHGEREITMYAPHTDENLEYYWQNGPEAPETMTVPVSGQFVDQNHNIVDVKGALKVDEWIKSEKSSDPQQYLITHTWYPNRWEFNFEEMVPEDIRHFTMTPIAEGGQTGYNASGAQYSEGGVYLRDDEDNFIGKGFAESVYYADAQSNMLQLAGLPYNTEMMELLKPAEPSSLLKLKSFFYLLNKRNKLKNIISKCLEQGLPTSFIEELEN